MRVDRLLESNSTLKSEVMANSDVDSVIEGQSVPDRSLVGSVAWNAASSWVIQFVSWLVSLVLIVISNIVVLCVRHFKLAWPRYSSIREPLRFGWHVTVSAIALNAYGHLDNFVTAGEAL